MSSVKSNYIYYLFKTFSALVIPLITFPYVSRVLLPENIGKINFVSTIITYFTMLAQFGVTTYGLREAAKIRDDKEKLKKITYEIVIINFITTVVSYCILFLYVYFSAKLFSYRKLILIYSLSIAFNTLGIEWLYCALEEYKYITIRQVFFQIISLTLIFIFVKTKNDYFRYAIICVFPSISAALCNIFHVRKFISLFKIKERLEIRKHIRPLAILLMLGLVQSVYTMLDTVMLGYLSDDVQVGYYTVGTRINHMVITLITVLNAVLLPRLSYYAEHDKSLFKKYFDFSFCFILAIAIPCVFGVEILAPQLVSLLSGDNFTDVVPVLRIISPIICILTISDQIGMQLFVPYRKDFYILISVVFGAFINVILNAILIPHYHAIGAALGSICAETIVMILKLCLSRKFITLKTFFAPLLQSLLGAIIMFLCLKILVNIIHFHLLINIFVFIVLGAMIYVFILLLFRNKTLIDVKNIIMHRELI